MLRRLQVLDEIGLGYLRLGQPATTLSGGEAQRIKIAAHLSSHSGERLLYVLDEPTTGLHFDDIAKLLTAFRKLLEAGHTLLVIEHNLDVIKTADYIIDLGPEGGDEGGRVSWRRAHRSRWRRSRPSHTDAICAPRSPKGDRMRTRRAVECARGERWRKLVAAGAGGCLRRLPRRCPFEQAIRDLSSPDAGTRFAPRGILKEAAYPEAARAARQGS